jgi:hypothetical protein
MLLVKEYSIIINKTQLMIRKSRGIKWSAKIQQKGTK